MTNENLPYFEEDAECPKCGNSDNMIAKTSTGGDLITITCGRCGWSWNVRPLDQMAEEVEEPEKDTTEPAGCGPACCDGDKQPGCCGDKGSPEKDEFETVRAQSKLVASGPGWELRQADTPSAELVELVTKSKRIIGFPDGALRVGMAMPILGTVVVL